MTDLITRLRLEASAGNSAAVIGGVRKDVQDLGQSGAKAGGGLDQATAAGQKLDRELTQVATHGQAARRGLDQAEAGARGFERSASGARAAGLALGSAMAAIGGRELVSAIKDAAFQLQGFETGLSAVTGGSQGAGEAQAFVREQAERLGLVVRESTAGYLQLAAATNGTALAGEKTRDIWLGLNEAGTVLNLSQEKQKLALEAISQIANKGVVSQEELRQQLAESLPGAYQVAARAMGMTTQAFGKLVDSGKLLSEDFLPKFASQLSTEFGPKVDQALTTPLGQARVEIAKFKNTVFDLEASSGGEFLAGMRVGLAELNAELASPDAQEAARTLGRVLGEGLSDAASIAAFLAKNLDGVTLAAQTIIGVGLARWLMTTTAEARLAAAAYLAKGQTAQAAAVLSVEGAAAETRAVTTLRGAIEATARAELQAAVVDREAALARQALAQATLAQHRAQLTSLSSSLASEQRMAAIAAAEAELVIAKNATAAASGRAAAAEAGLATASTTMGAAMRGASGVASGLMSLFGGPWGVALLAAGVAVGAVTEALGEAERAAAEMAASAKSYNDVMLVAEDYLANAADRAKSFGDNNTGAVVGTNALAGATSGLADQTIRLANARAQAALQGLQSEIETNKGRIDKLQSPSLGARIGNLALSSLDSFASRYAPDLGLSLANDNSAEIDELKSRNAKLGAQANKIIFSAQSYVPDTPKPVTPTATVTSKPDRQELRAQVKDSDLAAAVVAQNAHTTALVAGGKALDDWQVAEAGRQAVERLALADRPKLTASETTLVASIRQHAEETERLKIANERIEKAVGLSKSADLDTAALQRRSDAAAQGEAAIEALQVKEAGLRVLQQLGVDSLDQLTGKTLDHAKAAIASAEANERQSQATAKAERVAAQIRDLDKRIVSEKGYAAAMAGGTAALVAYQRAEFERQEIERAGTTITADQVAQIRAKADALFAAKAAADSADLDQRQAEELRLVRLTNEEREVEERFLQRKSLLLAEHADWTAEEVDARARALALADQASAQEAAAVGRLKQGFWDEFVESGHLAWDDLGDYLERTLRAAVYKALLAEPVNMLINAVVGSVSGLSGLGGGTSAGGISSLSSMFTSSGAMAGLASGSAKLITGLLNKTSMGGMDAARLGGLAGGAIGGAGTGMLMSSIAGALGLKQTKGNQIGGTIGGAIGSFIPIPGGTLIGAALGNLVGGLVGGKKSNEAAVLSLDKTGQVTSVGGAKRTDETTAAAQSIAGAVAQIQAALVAGGATLGATVSKIDIGQRDPTHLNFSNGTSIDTAVGDVSAAVEAATKAILANAKWATEAQTAYAQQMIAAGASVDDVIARLQVAGAFGASIDDAIAQLSDPVAYQRKAALDAIEANYKALKSQAEELITAGVLTTDALDKLAKLKDLQVADSIAKLGNAAGDAAAALDKLTADKSAATNLTGAIQDDMLAIVDPAAAKRKSALDKVERDYQARLTEAQALISAGVLGGEVIGQLDALKSLQIDQVLNDLAGAAVAATDAFADARPRLQSWLDGFTVSNDNQLNPEEEAKLAKAQYQRQLALAQSGDATAQGNITNFADQAIAADRDSTSSAADRLAFVQRVQADIAGLVGATGGGGSDAVVSTLHGLGLSLNTLVAATSPDGALATTLGLALTAAPVTIGNLPDFAPILTGVAVPQTDRLVASIDKMRGDLVAKLDEVKAATAAGSSALSAAVEAGLSAVESAVTDVRSAADQQSQKLGDLADDQRLSNLYLRQKWVA